MKKHNNVIRAYKYSLHLVHASSKGLLYIVLVINLIYATLPIINVWLLKDILDLITFNSIDANRIWENVFKYFVILVLLAVINSLKQLALNVLFKKAEHCFDCEFLEKLAYVPYDVLDTSNGKSSIDNAKACKNMLVRLSYQLFQYFPLIYSLTVALCAIVPYINGMVFVYLLLTIPGIVSNIYFENKMEKLRKEKSPDARKVHYYRWMLTDSWPAKDIRLYNLFEPIKERYDCEKNKYHAIKVKIERKQLLISILAELSSHLGEIVLTIFAIREVANSYITIGEMTVIISMGLTLSNSFRSIVLNLLRNCFSISEFVKPYFAFSDSIHPMCTYAYKKMEDFRELSFKNVSFKYPDSDKYVLDGVTFNIRKGETISLVGVNGSGKSTIIKLIIGIYQPSRGEILINGRPISEYTPCEIHSLFAIMFQQFVHYPLTFKENIVLSDLNNMNDSEAIYEAMRKAGVDNNIFSRMSDGLDTFLTRQFSENGVDLSGGEWQKIAIARTIFRKAEVYVLDEPSSALDAATEEKIFYEFQQLIDKKTGIMISHRISNSVKADRVLVLDSGKIVENGSHDELMALKGLYYRLYNLQKEKYTIVENM